MHKFGEKTKLFNVIALGLPFIIPIYLQVGLSKADDSQTWLTGSPSVYREVELPASTAIVNPANRDCSDHKFITRPFLGLPEISHTACGVQTEYGIVDSSGWLEMNGTRTAGKLTNFSYSPGAIPVPYSSTLINYGTAPGGSYLYFTNNLPGAINTYRSTIGEVEYKINHPADSRLQDIAGNPLSVKTDTLSFSSDGQWMVVEATNKAILRVNTMSLNSSVLPFGPAFNYDIGLAPGLLTAITSNGRWAAIYSKNYEIFRVYDLDTCTTTPNPITSPVVCRYKDLFTSVKQQIPGLQSLSRLRFVDNNQLSFFANYYTNPNTPSSQKLGKFRLGSTPEAVSQVKLEMLALGESYISGEGVFEYRVGTDIPDNRCHLSALSYPYLVGEELDFNSYNSVACSGAKTLHLTDGSIPESNRIKAQAKGKDNPTFNDEIYRTFLPGYRAQLEFIRRNDPDKVLLSIGGNDIGFSNILRRCLEPDTCYSAYEDRLELVREINGRFPVLVDTYTKIKQEGLPGARIYVIGYPQIALPNGSCAVNVRLNSQELEFADLATAYLDEVIKRAADRAGVVYVDTQEALSGHRLCEGVYENVAVNGLTAGDNTPSFLRGPIGNESYHPNQLGHRLLAQSVLKGTENMTKVTPLANSNSAPPIENGLAILNAPKTNRSINQINYDDDLTNDIIYREVWWDIYVKALDFSLKKLNPFSIVLNSEPTELGTFNSDASGNLSAEVRIPATVPTGFHTLHVYGTNVAGEPIDIYKTIYVAGSENDYDTDGLTNTEDSCDTLPNSGFDQDQDGVDDACDGTIGTAPVISATPPVVLAETKDIFVATEDNISDRIDDTPIQSTIFADTIQGSSGEEVSGIVLPDSADSGAPATESLVAATTLDSPNRLIPTLVLFTITLLSLFIIREGVVFLKSKLLQRRYDAMTS